MVEAKRAEEIRVLVVDDDPAVLETLRRILERRSWSVRTAGSADEAAVALHESPSRPIDLLVADVILDGGMSGLTLAETALRHQPGLPVLFISGYVGLDVKLEGTPDAAVDFLGKPLSPTHLLRKADALLARTRSGRLRALSA